MKHNKKQNPIVIGAAAVLLVLFCGVMAVLMYWENHILPDQLMTETTQPTRATQAVTETEPVTIPTEPTQPTEPPESLLKDGVLRMLLTGQDRREGEGRGRSDTMILCVFDTRTNTLSMVSFLRDMFLEIPGHGTSRLNAAYAWGGFELLNETLAQNFDVQVDGNLEMDFYGFVEIIDYLGGVDLELTAEEAAFLNENGDWSILDHEPWDLQAGVNHLTGSQALDYSRIRFIDSDFERTERQRNVLTAIFRQFQNATLQEVSDAMDALFAQSTGTFTQEELMAFALELYPMLLDCEIVTRQIPADGTWNYATIDGMSVIQADLEANRQAIRDLFGE